MDKSKKKVGWIALCLLSFMTPLFLLQVLYVAGESSDPTRSDYVIMMTMAFFAAEAVNGASIWFSKKNYGDKLWANIVICSIVLIGALGSLGVYGMSLGCS